ncbi:hypothetical protein B0O99DRAFT_687974 [Bisporella sp. PMI_857]|nr:hypothetical protein B0O99DRAFT_687974 [Bisporella sp. PMI_857]
MSMESGARWTLKDATGQQLYRWDSAKTQQRQSFDALRRPTGLFITTDQVKEDIAHYAIYGETVPQAKRYNLLGGAYQRMDQNRLQAISTQRVTTEGLSPETTWYRYDGSGKRLRNITERQAAARKTPAHAKSHFNVGSYEVFRKYNGNVVVTNLLKVTSHVSGPSGRIALLELDTAPSTMTPADPIGRPPTPTTAAPPAKPLTRYAVEDSLSPITLELNDTGQVVPKEEFSPYGSVTFMSTNLTIPKRYRFAAKERDIESGLPYSENRYLMPCLERWLFPDPIGLSDGPNVYAYVKGNPNSNSDPTGTMRNNASANPAPC